MIQGKTTTDSPEEIEEQRQEEYYNIGLEMIAGVEGRWYGVMNEVNDLEKLIETIGKTVEKEEREFKDIMQTEYEEESGELTPIILENWHKKMYRQFTYKSLIMLVHTSFGNWCVNLYDYLIDEKRSNVKVHSKVVLDIVEGLQDIDSNVPPLIKEVRAFNFLRNRIAHNDGYYNQNLKDYDVFKKYISNRKDIEIKKLITPKGKNTHRVQIRQSSIINDYLQLIKKVFGGLIKGAEKLEIITTQPATNEN